MTKKIFTDIESIRNEIGNVVSISDWFEITQERVNAFADATGDHQWIHIDPVRAKAESPFKKTIAHGYFTLSLIAKFSGECIGNTKTKMAINYGTNKVRFPSPVLVGSRIRAHFLLGSMDEIEGGVQVQWEITIEIEGQPKPACVAETLTRWYY